MSNGEPDRFHRLERALEAWMDLEDGRGRGLHAEDEDVRALVEAMRGASPERSRIDRVGDFQLLRELGRGGMGTVYEAIDLRLERRVALKVVPIESAESQASTAIRSRFRREAAAAARLRHPAICQVFGSGEDDGRLWIAMELIEGGSLAERLRDGQLPGEAQLGKTTAVVQLLAQLADALDFAHRSGVIHRDVKAQNILFDADEQARIVDFGVAKLVDRSALTQTGDFAGSLAYASPEQIAGVREIDGRTDIWSLAVVGFEALTSKRPFAAPKHEALLRAILGREPDFPSSIPHDLRVILACALEKERERRYESAAAMAEDLRRFLAHEAIAAAPPSTVSRITRFVRRRRRALGLGVAASVLAGLAIWSAARAAQSESDITDSVENARGALEELRAMVDTGALAAQPYEFAERRARIERIVARAEGLLRLRRDNQALARTVARTQEQAALLYQRLKAKREALHAHARAIELLEELVKQRGGDAQSALAASLHNRHVLLRALGRHEKADADLERAIATWTAFVQEKDTTGGDADSARARLALAHTNRARRRTGSERAHEDLTRAEALWQRCEAPLRAAGRFDAYVPHLQQTRLVRARHAIARGEEQAAADALRSLEAQQSKLSAKLRSKIAIASLEAEAGQLRGALHFASGDLDAADRAFVGATAILAKIARSGTADSRCNLAKARVQRATFLQRAGRLDELDAMLPPALREAEQLALDHPLPLSWAMHATLLVLKSERVHSEDPDAALQLLRSAVELEKRVGFGHDFASGAAHTRLAARLFENDEHQAAIALAEASFELTRKRLVAEPDDPKAQAALAMRARQLLGYLDRRRASAAMLSVARRVHAAAPASPRILGLALLAVDRACARHRPAPKERDSLRRDAVALASEWVEQADAKGAPWRIEARTDRLRYLRSNTALGPRLLQAPARDAERGK